MPGWASFVTASVPVQAISQLDRPWAAEVLRQKADEAARKRVSASRSAHGVRLCLSVLLLPCQKLGCGAVC